MSSWQDIVVEASELSFEGLDRSLEEVVDVAVAFASSSEEAAAVTSVWPLCRNFITLRPPRGREPWPNDNVESRWVCRDDDKKDAKDAGCCNKFNFCLRNAVSYEPSEDGGDGHEGNRYGVIHHRRRSSPKPKSCMRGTRLRSVLYFALDFSFHATTQHTLSLDKRWNLLV